jgi:hypothetical protein
LHFNQFAERTLEVASQFAGEKRHSSPVSIENTSGQSQQAWVDESSPFPHRTHWCGEHGIAIQPLRTASEGPRPLERFQESLVECAGERAIEPVRSRPVVGTPRKYPRLRAPQLLIRRALQPWIYLGSMRQLRHTPANSKLLTSWTARLVYNPLAEKVAPVAGLRQGPPILKI